MRIAMVISSLRVGGSERVCVSLANAIVQQGHAVTVYCLNLRDAKYHENLRPEIVLRNLNSAHLRTSVHKLIPIVGRHRHDCILCFTFEISVVLAILRSLLWSRCPIVARTPTALSDFRECMRGIWRRHITHWLTRRFYRKCDILVAQCEDMRVDLIQKYDCEPSRTLVIPNPLGPDLAEFSVLNAPVAERNRFAKSLLFVGGLQVQKDPALLLRAFGILKRTRKDVVLRFAGSGPLLGEMKALSDELGVSDCVEFLGFVKDVRRLYCEADVTVLSSRVEGYPNALIESMAQGTPTVSVACRSGPREMICDGVNGFLVEQREPGALAAGIERALRHPWDGNAVRASVAHHHVDLIRDRYLSLFASVTGAHKYAITEADE